MTDPDPSVAESLPPDAGADDIDIEELRLPHDPRILTLVIETAYGPQTVLVPYSRNPQGWSQGDGIVWVRSSRVQ